jgi:peptidoglycan hydrolase CwlO-like protein
VFLVSQVDALVKEKRTDVVKRFEDEIERLNAQTSDLNDKIAALTAERAKNDARLKELQGRVDIAEGELKDRDAK